MMASAENQDIKLFWTQETLPDLTPEAVARRGPSETGLLGLSAATFAWHRDLFDRFGAIDPDKSPIISDWILPFRAILLNGITYLNKPLVRVRRHVGARWRRFFADSGNANSQGEQSCANAIVQRRHMQETLEDFLCANPKATSRFGHLRKVLAGALEEDLADWISSRNRLMREELRPSWIDPDTLLRQSDAFEKKLEVMRSELKEAGPTPRRLRARFSGKAALLKRSLRLTGPS
jgi:hypothetical protein